MPQQGEGSGKSPKKSEKEGRATVAAEDEVTSRDSGVAAAIWDMCRGGNTGAASFPGGPFTCERTVELVCIPSSSKHRLGSTLLKSGAPEGVHATHMSLRSACSSSGTRYAATPPGLLWPRQL